MNKNVFSVSLFKFYVITVVVLTALCYLLLFVDLVQHRTQKSIDLFANVQHNLTEAISKDDRSIQQTLSLYTDSSHISYQVMIMTPSGQPLVHNYHRDDQSGQRFFLLPDWQIRQNEEEARAFYDLNSQELVGWMPLPEGYQAYVQIFHIPLSLNWTNTVYWLPLLVALTLLIIAWYIVLSRKKAWQYLINYSHYFPSHLNEPYQPLRAEKLAINIEFQRLASSLNRINQQMHHTHRRNRNLAKRLSRISDYAPLPMLMMNRSGQITYFNKRFEQTFLTIFQEEITYLVTDFFIGRDKITQQELTRLGSLRKPSTFAVISLDSNTDYLLHLQPWIGEQGQVKGFCALLTDISLFTHELKNINNKVQQQADKLIEYDKLWSVLGHELRTPLSGMIGLLELMDTDNFDEEQVDTYTVLTQTSQSMLSMLNDMLDMAKMEAGKLSVINERTDLLVLCQQVGDLMAGNARQQGIELLIYFAPQCPRYMDTDNGRLRQTLMNLLGNAIKFTRTGYVALLVGTRKANDEKLVAMAASAGHKLQTKQSQGWLCFTIKDTGIGISETDMAKLFSRFNQANDSISLQFGGTGLGLAISNSFAKLLGGFIYVNSSVGVGSEFTLCLPYTQTSHQPVYQFNANLSHICLIAFTNQKMATDALQALAEHIGFACLAYTGINAQYIQKFDTMQLCDFSIVLLIEEELYQTSRQQIDTLLALPIFKKAPKILLSMQPKTAMSLEHKQTYQSFLSKPLAVNQLIKEMLRLTGSGADAPLLSSPKAANTTDDSDDNNRKEDSINSKVQQRFETFMQTLNRQDDTPSAFDKNNEGLAYQILDNNTQDAIEEITATTSPDTCSDPNPDSIKTTDSIETTDGIETIDSIEIIDNIKTIDSSMSDRDKQNNTEINEKKDTQDKIGKQGLTKEFKNHRGNKSLPLVGAVMTELPTLILIAEDDPINRKVACKILDKLGYRSITANNGEEALQKLDQHSQEIELILMDCRMPIMNGFEATRHIRASHRSLPIVALTANDTDTDREECFNAGMNAVLSKPLKKEQLIKVLHKFKVTTTR